MTTVSSTNDFVIIYSGTKLDNTDKMYFLNPLDKREDARYLLNLPITVHHKNPVITEDVLRKWLRSIGNLEKCFVMNQKWHIDFTGKI